MKSATHQSGRKPSPHRVPTWTASSAGRNREALQQQHTDQYFILSILLPRRWPRPLTVRQASGQMITPRQTPISVVSLMWRR